ncbi:MAG: YihY/virulence factor BrkB family protein [Flavobacteriales bacterium]|nr:YihY/virulence factor BrkB family protein [Flavobacteriales bacterium]
MVRRLIVRFLRLRAVHWLLDFSKRVRLPGFDGLPLYDVATFFIIGLQKGSLNIRASSVAFNFILAVFPGIIFLFTLLAYIPYDGFQGQLLDLMREFLPNSTYVVVRETFEDVITQQRGGLLSLTVISALYFSTNGISALIDGFNATFHTYEKRSPVMQRAIALGLMLVLVSIVIVAIGLIIFGSRGIQFLLDEGLIRGMVAIWAVNLSRWAVVLLLLFLAVTVLYVYGPARKARWGFFSAGSTLTTGLIILSSLGFRYFVENFGTYNKLYGSIGTLLVVMLWMLINSTVLLIGFELNASIERAKLKELENKERTLHLSLEKAIQQGDPEKVS